MDRLKELKERVVHICIENKVTVSFMESVTGGLLASLFTDIAGASGVFRGSLVTYSNEEKVRAGVPACVIEREGVYSTSCANAMAKAIYDTYHVDMAVGITGTTGNPDPANPEGLLGEAFFSVMYEGKMHEYIINDEMNSMSREEIKKYYATKVYETMLTLLRA